MSHKTKIDKTTVYVLGSPLGRDGSFGKMFRLSIWSHN